MVAEYEMKMYMVQPVFGGFKFAHVDSLIAFSKRNKIKVRGVALIMAANSPEPEWLLHREWDKKDLEFVLKNYINTMVSRYKGKIYSWDVINEGLRYDGKPEWNVWYSVLGKEYLEKAYIWAHEADPNAKLFYNDYDCYEKNDKSDALYAMLKDFKSRGIPIHGIGFEMHCVLEGPKRHIPDFKKVAENMKRFSDLGMEIHFTEVDVAMQYPVTPEKLDKQAHIYAELMRLCLSNKACKAYVVWGFSDLYSWIPSYMTGYGYACLFDYNYSPKPAYDSLMAVYKNWGKVPAAIKFRQIRDRELMYVFINSNYASGYRYEVQYSRCADVEQRGTIFSDTLHVIVNKAGTYIVRVWPIYRDWDTMSVIRSDTVAVGRQHKTHD
jgi:endo-1,4-beta-xylanase